jgi:hypothetical protein
MWQFACECSKGYTKPDNTKKMDHRIDDNIQRKKHILPGDQLDPTQNYCTYCT